MGVYLRYLAVFKENSFCAVHIVPKVLSRRTGGIKGQADTLCQ